MKHVVPRNKGGYALVGFHLSGKCVFVTRCAEFMGPALCEVFRELGADITADGTALVDPDAPGQLVAAAGHIDILIANLAYPAPTTTAARATDEEWRSAFSHMVDLLPRLVRAVLPQMIDRRSGKILVMGSAAALRGMKRASTYSAARGAQLAHVQAVGVEVAPYNIQVNAIAQSLVDNVTYFPPAVKATSAFKERIRREVPLGRLVTPREDALLAAYLCSDAANCFVGQIFPLSGGWVTR